GPPSDDRCRSGGYPGLRAGVRRPRGGGCARPRGTRVPSEGPTREGTSTSVLWSCLGRGGVAGVSSGWAAQKEETGADHARGEDGDPRTPAGGGRGRRARAPHRPGGGLPGGPAGAPGGRAVSAVAGPVRVCVVGCGGV